MNEPTPSANPCSLAIRFARYTSAGAIGAIMHFLILIFLVQFLFAQPVLASITGFVAGAIVNFLLSHHWVFQSNRPRAETAPRFFLIASIGLGLNAAMMYFLVTMLHVHYLLGQIATTGSVLIWNYLGSSLWAFSKNTKE